MTTPVDFIRGASWLAKRAANWSGEVACNIQGNIYDPGEPMKDDVLRRFRKEIIMLLDSITPST